MIALFDLDDTLLRGDSNHLWGRFLIDRSVVNEADYLRDEARFDREFHAGTIDFHAYLTFTLKPLRDRDHEELSDWQREFAQHHAVPAVEPRARALIESHRERGHTLIMATATNRFFVEPFARLLQMHALLASDLQKLAGRYTGRPVGEPCFGQGKLAHFRRWTAARRRIGEESWFYSDSHTDIPLLEHVDHPTAVNPDAALRRIAEQRGWPILVFRSRD